VAAPTTRPRILLVDDEADVQDVVAELLTGVGYDVDAVASGEGALDAVACCPYDLVISDLRLPGCSGTTLNGEIARRHPRLANRIILLTGELDDPPVRCR
jgi:CheY-like chemotaxis protein